MAADELIPVSLDPNPVIEAYKKDVDRTLLRENLKLTVEQRILKMIAALRLLEEIQRSSKNGDDRPRAPARSAFRRKQ